MNPIIDLTGQVFNRWTVLHRVVNPGRGEAKWLCRCVCGVERAVASSELRLGNSRSCGCLKLEELVLRVTKHGHSLKHDKSPTYRCWAAMLSRCRDPGSADYVRYGGRGITVCKQWQEFAAFLADMGEKPANKTLDRRDNNGPYTPENCRWATRSEQARNRTTSRLLTFRGQTKTLAEWSVLTGIHRATLWDRLNTGWSVVAALTTPTGESRLPLPDRSRW